MEPVLGTVEFNVFDPAAPSGLAWRQFQVSEFRAKEDGWEYRIPGENLGWLPADMVRGFRLRQNVGTSAEV